MKVSKCRTCKTTIVIMLDGTVHHQCPGVDADPLIHNMKRLQQQVSYLLDHIGAANIEEVIAENEKQGHVAEPPGVVK